MLIKFFFSFLVLLITMHSFGQGRIPEKNKSYLGAFTFLKNSKLAEGYSTVKMSGSNENDALIDPENWYNGGDVQMRGMMGDAVLFLEWWTKSSSPAERYKFDWTSSGYFELYNLSDHVTTPKKRINRSDLTKYPNLLKRFDDIAPIDIQFQFTFSTIGIPDQQYADFRRRYKIMEDLGSAGYAVTYTRNLEGDFILYKPSRRKQDWINPGPIPGGWDTFLNMPEKYADKKSRLIELFKLGENLLISSFKITSIKWRMADFEYIARKFKDYETGKDKPTVFDEVAEGEKKNKAGDESWDETDLVDSDVESFMDNNSKTLGLKTRKRIIKSFSTDEYNGVSKLGNTNYFVLRSKNMGDILVNKSGQKQLIGGYENFYSINQNEKGQIIATKHLTSISRVKDDVFHYGNGISGNFNTEQEARAAINNFKVDLGKGSGLVLGFRDNFGIVKFQKLTLDNKLGLLNKAEGYSIQTD